MSNEVDYANTYWCQKGKHEALDTELRKLVPESGEVENTDANPALERYRVASNCYYDLYNNGLCNRGREFHETFAFDAFDVGEPHWSRRHNEDSDERDYGGSVELTQKLIDRTESAMDEIILAAAAEQHLGGTNGVTIDITPVGCQTPEGAKRVAEAQREWNSATHLLANILKEFLDLGVTLAVKRGSKLVPDFDAMSQIQALIGARDRKSEAFLRAVAGKPKLYPANVNGKRVLLSIPED